MSNWKVKISKEAEKDFDSIDGSVRKQVLAGILKVSRAPLPAPNGYGKPLGNKGGNNLTGFLKINIAMINTVMILQPNYMKSTEIRYLMTFLRSLICNTSLI